MNRSSATSRLHKAALALITLAVMALSALLHSGGLHDVIAWDEANYAFAAREGVIANAIQMGEVNELRHDHAPLMAYVVAASMSVLGGEEWAVRLPVVLFSALSCGLLVLAAHDLSRGRPDALRLVAGGFAGLMLATSPASIEIAGVLQPHTFVVFFIILNIWTLTRYLRDLHRRDALLFGATLAGQFISMEYGPVILFFALAAVLLTHPRLLLGDDVSWSWSPRRWFVTLMRAPMTMHRDIKAAAIVCIALIMLLWPAGVFLLGAPMNFAYYVLYAAHGHPILFRGRMYEQVPKYAYAYWYWLDHPLLLVGMIALLVAIAVHAWRERYAAARSLFVFAFGLVAVVHASHIMQLCKSIFMIPGLALAGGVCGVWCIERLLSRASLRALVAPAVLILCITILGGRLTPMSRGHDPNLRLVDMTRTIAQQAGPDERILAQGWPMVRYLLHLKFNRPDLIVERYDPRNYESDHLGRRLEQHEFAWAVTIGPTTAAYKECKALARLRSTWTVASDRSDQGKEYRVYHAPAAVRAIEAQSASATDSTLEEVQR